MRSLPMITITAYYNRREDTYTCRQINFKEGLKLRKEESDTALKYNGEAAKDTT
jgi:hypothetical protein